MPAKVPSNPLTSGWMLFSGIVVAGAALNEAMRRMSQIPHSIHAKRPSAQNTIIIGLLLKNAFEQLGTSATGTPAPK